MKKTLLVLSLLASLVMVACQKESTEQPTGGDNPPAATEPAAGETSK